MRRKMPTVKIRETIKRFFTREVLFPTKDQYKLYMDLIHIC